MGLVKLVHKIEERFDRFEDAGLTVFLVLLCLLSFGLLPMVDLDGVSRHLVSAAYTLLFVLGAFLGDLGPRTRVFALLLGLFAVAVDWLQELAPSLLTDTLNIGTSIVFMLLVCVALLVKSTAIGYEEPSRSISSPVSSLRWRLCSSKTSAPDRFSG